MTSIPYQPQDGAAAHASLSLLTSLIGLLIKKKLITVEEATKLAAECAMVLSTGGPVNQLAAQILRQLSPTHPPAPATRN